MKYQRVWVKYCANHLHEQEYRPLVHSLKVLRVMLESEDCDQIIQHSFVWKSTESLGQGVLFWEKVNKKWREFATKRLKGK